MAESSDQAETSLQLSIYQGSREDFEHSCGQCLIDGNDIETHGFCIVCNEYLCITCFRAHGKNKASKHHTLLGESELQNVKKADESSTICTDKCPVHADGILIFYCTNHKELCCNDCVVISHRHCHIDYIPEKYSDILESTEYQKALQAIDTRQKTIDNVNVVAKKEEMATNTSNEAVLREISVFEQELYDLLERKLKTIKLEAGTKREERKHTLKRVFETCNAVSSNLEILRKEILESKEKKSLAQLLIAIKKTENALKSGEVNDSVKLLRDTKSQYHYERSADMETLPNLCFGTINDNSRKPRDAIFTQIKIKTMVCAVLSIGSTKMTFGVSFSNEPNYVLSTKEWRNSQGLASQEAPTSLLIDPDGHSVCGFGYEAEQTYDSIVREGKQSEYFFFSGDYILKLYREWDKDITCVHDETGKKLPSLFVLSTLLRVLYEEVMSFLKEERGEIRKESDVHFVITAPEIFASARKCLKEAAEQVDVDSENFTVLLETEASFAYIQHTTSYYRYKGYDSFPFSQSQEGDRYIVLDIRDKRSTITVYETGKEKSTLLYHEPIESLEEDTLMEELEEVLSGIFGHKIWQMFQSSYEGAYREMMSENDTKMLSLKPESNLNVTIYSELSKVVERNTSGTVKDLVDKLTCEGNVRYTSGKLRIGYSILEKCFQPIVSTITSELRLVLQDKVGLGCNILIMTGDCTYMDILEICLKRNFPDFHIVIPISPESAVVVGAAILGHLKPTY